MLQRNRLQSDQENPSHQPAPFQHPSKTPLRQQGPSKPSLTAGKGLGAARPTTGKSGRVLGSKDGNQGKGITGLTQLSFSKSTAKAGPSCAAASPVTSRAQAFLSPPAQPTLPSYLRTPSPGLHKFASLSLLSPDDAEMELEAEMEEDERPKEPAVDREVEYAGPSAADYDEPYEPEFPLPDFKTAGFGTLLRGIPLTGSESYENWALQDEADRNAFKVSMDVPISPPPNLRPPSPSSERIFPLPARRAPLLPKVPNARAAPPPTSTKPRPTSLLGTSTSSRPLSSSSRKPLTSAPPTTSTFARKSLVATATPKPKSTWGAPAPTPRPLTSSVSRRSLPSSLSRLLPSSTVSRPPLRQTKMSMTASLVTLPEDEPGVGGVDREAERALGIWGLGDEGEEGVESWMGVGGEDEEAEEEFRFDV